MRISSIQDEGYTCKRMSPPRRKNRVAFSVSTRHQANGCFSFSELHSSVYPTHRSVISGCTVFERQTDTINDVVGLAVRIAEKFPFDLRHE